MKSPRAYRSSPAVGLSCTAHPLTHSGKPQDLEFGFRRAAADGRQFVALRVAVEVRPRLHHRDSAPADVLENLPGSHAVAVNRDPAGTFIRADPLLARGDAAGLEVVFTETREAGAGRWDVLLRVGGKR